MAELTRRDRVMAAGHLDGLAEELDRISTWMYAHDEDKAGVLIECASRDLRAAAWLVRPDDGSRPEGWLMRSDGHQQGP
jgi:hypothetical protein